MKIFPIDYLEAYSGDIDCGNDWNWNPIYSFPNQQTGSEYPTGHRTKTLTMTFHHDENTDQDLTKENLGMLVA